MSEIVLGFDISSQTIGWCALRIDDGYTISIIKYGYIKPPKKGHILERIVKTRDEVNKVINEIKPNYIGVEDLIKFMVKSTATTVVVLTSFNRMVCVTAYDYLQKYPELFNVMTIRHGLKLNKILPSKQDMPDLVAKHLGFTFPYEKNKKGKIKDENYDAADGIAVALYYAFMLTGRAKKKGKKK